MLLQELTEKLPPQIKLNWAMYKKTIATVTISTFATWLQDMAEAASEVTLSFHESSPVASSSKHFKEKGKGTQYAGKMTIRSKNALNFCVLIMLLSGRLLERSSYAVNV